MEYSEMTVQQRAEYLLEKGVVAKIDIDPDSIAPAYVAYVAGVGKLFCGYHNTEDAAIDAGIAFLRAKAALTPQENNDGCH